MTVVVRWSRVILILFICHTTNIAMELLLYVVRLLQELAGNVSCMLYCIMCVSGDLKYYDYGC